jgi:hypothetical protein
MVKSIVPVVRSADYEAQHRTLAVSEKSRIGVPLIEIIDDHRQVVASFQSERFVHAQVREYLLRSAAHSTTKVQRTFSGESISRPSHLDVAKQLCKSNLSLTSLGSLPKQLRAFVVAQILKDVKFDVKIFEDNQRFYRSLSLRDTVTMLMSYLIVSGSIQLTKDHTSGRKMTSSIRIAEKISSDKVSRSSSISSKKESDFSTAPIWYQQSMENGPPLSRQFSLERRKRKYERFFWLDDLDASNPIEYILRFYLKVDSWTL